MTPLYYTAGTRYAGCGHRHRTIKGAKPCLARFVAFHRARPGWEPVRVVGIWAWRQGDRKAARWLVRMRIA